MYVVFCFLVFACQYQCNRLPGKTCLWNDLLCVEWDQWYFTPRNAPLTPSQFWDHTPTVQLHWWSDWTITCCKTVEDPHCPVTVLLAIAIRCFALFTGFQILHEIWKFCVKLGHLIPAKVLEYVATRGRILKLKCTKFNFGCGCAPDSAAGGAYSASPDSPSGIKRPTSKRKEVKT